MERAFRIFDKDGSGTVSLAEFIETMHQFSGQGEDEKISFLFKVYDLNGESLKAAFQCFPFLDYAEILREIVESFAAGFLESLIMA